MMKPREMTGPQKSLVGGLVALTLVLIALIVVGMIAKPRPAAAPSRAEMAWRSIKSEAGVDLPDIHVAIIPAGLSAEDVDRQARAKCAGRQVCKVMGWVDGAKAASAFPMTEREYAAQSYSYDLNRQTDLDRSLFDCRVWSLSRARCLSNQ